jgi:hypothetical protein
MGLAATWRRFSVNVLTNISTIKVIKRPRNVAYLLLSVKRSGGVWRNTTKVSSEVAGKKVVVKKEEISLE